MAVNDPIADMLTRIRNAQMALHRELAVPKSKMKTAIAEILQQEGYIQSFEEGDWDVRIRLKYMRGKPVIAGLKRVSKPSCRQYVGVDEIPEVQSGLGINILSTSRGVVEGHKAKELRVGGELLCQIW
jgi:small subunit ribosomal protein S8